jgi:hypothetical protein
MRRLFLFLMFVPLLGVPCKRGEAELRREAPDQPPGLTRESQSDRWTLAGPLARAQLEDQKKRNPDQLFVEMRPDQRIAYVFGSKLTSDACAQKATRGIPPDDRYRQLALCFLGEMEQAIAGEASRSLVDTVREAEFGPGPDEKEGSRVLHLHQFHDGVRVGFADARVFFHAGRVVAFSGNLVDTESFPHRASPAPDLQRGAEEVAGHKLRLHETYFDPKLKKFVVKFYNEDRGRDPYDYLMDEATGRLLAREHAGMRSPEPIQSLDYTASWTPTGPTQKTVEMTITPVPGGFSHQLRNQAQGAPTFTYHSPGTFLPGQDPPCNNEPRNLAAQFASTPTATPWSTVTSGGMFEAGNAYYWINQLNEMRTHWSSSFGYTQRQVDLDLIVGPCLLSGAGEYYATSGMGGDLYLGSSQDDNPTWNALSTIAHEYGHYVHDRYNNNGTRALKEGFAETFIARWLRYANEFRGEWTSLTYDESSMAQKQHNGVLVNGEFVLGPVPSEKAHLYYPATPQCTANEDWGGPESEPYACGGVVPTVFWELLWDICRLGYGSCDDGQDIIQTGPYASTARRLANNAYTWAITTVRINAGRDP